MGLTQSCCVMIEVLELLEGTMAGPNDRQHLESALLKGPLSLHHKQCCDGPGELPLDEIFTNMIQAPRDEGSINTSLWRPQTLKYGAPGPYMRLQSAEEDRSVVDGENTADAILQDEEADNEDVATLEGTKIDAIDNEEQLGEAILDPRMMRLWAVGAFKQEGDSRHARHGAVSTFRCLLDESNNSLSECHSIY